jgi:UDP-galactopyranose mutase
MIDPIYHTNHAKFGVPTANRKILIVGAGLYGAVCAYMLTKAGHHVRIIEKRGHVGGNCYTRYNEATGSHEHVYGAHIFHTSSKRIWQFVTQLTEFNNYSNRVKVNFKGTYYSFPINLFTLHQLYGVKSPQEAIEKLAAIRVPIQAPQNLEEYCLSTVGPDIYRIFFEGYTKKQWGRHPRNLPANIIKRLPIRTNFNDDYYNDIFQGIPIHGYSALFERLLEGVPIELNMDFLNNRDEIIKSHDLTIYTGPIDAFFRYSRGALEYRSLRFETEVLDCADFQGNAVVNYTDSETPWTRIIEHKHFNPSIKTARTIITREFPLEWHPGLPEYYPVNDSINTALLRAYQEDAQAFQPHVHFGGRLAQYRYYDMDQVIAAALHSCNLIDPEVNRLFPTPEISS